MPETKALGKKKKQPVTPFLFSDCPSVSSTTALDPTLSCYMDSRCQKLECCVDTQFLQHTLSSFIDLDICNQRLTVGIQGRSYVWSTEAFTYGENVEFDLHGIMTIRYANCCSLYCNL